MPNQSLSLFDSFFAWIWKGIGRIQLSCQAKN